MFVYGGPWSDDLGRPGAPQQGQAARRKLWLLTAPTALAWAVAGWSGALGILDQFRLMSLNRIESWETRAGPSPSLTMIFAVAVTGASMLGFAMMWTRLTALGWSSGGFHAGGFATSLGLTVGTALAITSWTAPETVGSRGPGEPWIAADWVIYHEPYLLPAVFGLGAVVTGALTLRAAWTATKREDAEDALRRRGRRVRGTIEHVEFTSVWVQGQPRFRVRVRFPGALGERTVVTVMTTSPFAAPTVGSTVDVLYDPADETSVIVEPVVR